MLLPLVLQICQHMLMCRDFVSLCDSGFHSTVDEVYSHLGCGNIRTGNWVPAPTMETSSFSD